MKVEEKEKAIQLRKEGWSLKEIAEHLKVAKSSVSVWVRGVILTDEQLLRLHGKRVDFRRKGSQGVIRACKERRDKHRKLGRELINDRRAINIALLYWAEGYKKNNRSSMRFVNSDPAMINLFIKDLVDLNLCNIDKIKISIHFHDDIRTEEEVVKYWLNITKLSEKAISGVVKNKVSKASSLKRKGFLEWGTCNVVVNSVEVLQKIYGIIDALSESYGMGTISTKDDF